MHCSSFPSLSIECFRSPFIASSCWTPISNSWTTSAISTTASGCSQAKTSSESGATCSPFIDTLSGRIARRTRALESGSLRRMAWPGSIVAFYCSTSTGCVGRSSTTRCSMKIVSLSSRRSYRSKAISATRISSRCSEWSTNSSFTFSRASGTVSCANGGRTKATRMCSIFIIDAMPMWGSTTATATRQFHDTDIVMCPTMQASPCSSLTLGHWFFYCTFHFSSSCNAVLFGK